MRADYADPLYARMASEAMQLWRHSPLFSRWYHPVGLLRVGKNDMSKRCLAAFEMLNLATEARFISVGEARSRWAGVFADANFGDQEQCYWQPDAGWVNADKALEATIQAAISQGVQYVEAVVDKLVVTADGVCTGVELVGGQILTADRVLLALVLEQPLCWRRRRPITRKSKPATDLLPRACQAFTLASLRRSGQTSKKPQYWPGL